MSARLGRRGFVVVVLGFLLGVSGYGSSADAAGCATEGALGEVNVPGVGNVDLDPGAQGSGTLCAGVLGTSVQIFLGGYDSGGNYTDTSLGLCISGASDPVCPSGPPPPITVVGVAVANEDVPAVDVTGDGLAVTAGQGGSVDTLKVTVLNMAITQNVPRVCQEVGSAQCENADRLIP